jgi:site-specific DNA-methyltransferase (adenine-specific)
MIKRNKFDLYELANLMLDQIPEQAFKSKTTTFLDPAMGGGQFCHAIEDRLRKYGHSEQNISKRVFGFESVIMDIRFAVNKYNLVGQYSLVKPMTFLETETFGMKFDVIVGNPPYQGTNQKEGKSQPKSHNLWSKFVAKGTDLLGEDGYMAFVTPDSWMSYDSKVMKIFKEHSLSWVSTDVAKYFDVGSSFTAWILQNNKSSNTALIDGINVDISNLMYLPRNFEQTYPIHNKVINSNHEKLEVKTSTTCHSDYKQGNLSDQKTKTHKYDTFHTNAQSKFSNKMMEDFDKPKVVWTTSGYFKPFFHKGGLNTTEVCQYVVVNTQKEARHLMSLLDSKLYKFIINTGKWSGFLNGKVIKSLPSLEDKIWSDADLYKHFGLTSEEIDYIETNQ